MGGILIIMRASSQKAEASPQDAERALFRQGAKLFLHPLACFAAHSTAHSISKFTLLAVEPNQRVGVMLVVVVAVFSHRPDIADRDRHAGKDVVLQADVGACHHTPGYAIPVLDQATPAVGSHSPDIAG